MPQVSQEVLLKVIAQVADAVKGLEQVRTEVRSLAAEVKARSPFKLDVQIGEDLKRLAELRAAIEATLKTFKGGTVGGSIKLDLSGIDAQLKDLAARVKAGVDSIKTAFEGLAKVKATVPPLAEKANADFQKFNAELRKLESQFQGAVNRLNNAARGVTFDPLSRSATLARDKVRIAAENMVEFLAKIPPAVQRDEAAFASLQAKIEGLRAAGERLSKIQVVPPGGVPAAASLTSSIGSLEKAFALAAAAGQLFFASIVAQKLIDLGKSAVQAASDLQILTGQLEIFVGGPDQAAVTLDHLREVADSVGISFIDLTENFQKFLVPAQASGLTLEETQQIFDAISIAVAGAGKSTEEVAGIFKTFTDVMQKGVIQAEELVKQFANNGIPATALLAAAYGKTTAELREMTAEHQILARDGIPALAAEMLKVYGPAALKNVESFRSENERFANAVFDIKKAFGDELLPVLVETIQNLRELKSQDSFGDLGSDLATVIGLFNDLAGLIRDITSLNFESLGATTIALFTRIAEAGVRSFGALQVAAAKVAESLNIAPDGFADKVRQSVDAAIKELQRIRGVAREIGKESRAGTDEAAKGVDDLETHWKTLYDNLKKQQAEHQKNSGEVDEKVTKKLQTELKKREGSYRGFFETIADLTQRADDNPLKPPTAPGVPSTPGTVSGPTVTPGDTSSLDKLRADLAAALVAKRALFDQALTNPVDQTKVDELAASIRELEDRITSEGKAAAAAAREAADALADAAARARADAAAAAAAIEAELGGKAVEALRKLILGSDDFAKAFADLSPKSQAAITGIIQGFEQLAQSGRVSREDIEAFGRALLNAFQQGGLVGQQFATQIAAAFGGAGASTQSLAQILRQLAAETVKTKDGAVDLAANLDKLAGGSLPATTASAETAATAVRRAGESAKEFDERVRSLIDTSGTASGAVDGLTVGTEKASAGFIKAHGDSAELKDGIFEVGGAAAENTVKVDGLTQGLAKAGENIIRVRDGAKTLTPGVYEIGTASEKAKEGVDKLATAQPPAKLAEGLDATAASADKVVEPLDKIAASAAKLGDGASGEGVARLGESLTAVTGPATAAAAPMALVADAASKLAEAVAKLVTEPGLGTVGEQLTPLLVPLQSLAEPATTLAVALTSLGAATATIKPEGLTALGEAGAKLVTVVEPAGQAAAALAPVGEAAATAGASLGTLNTNAGLVATQLAAIGTAAGELVAALGDPALATGLDALGESLLAASPELSSVADSFDRLSTSLDGAKASIPEVAKGIEGIAKAVSEPTVKQGLGDLGDAVEKIEKAAAGAGSGLKSVSDAMTGITGTAVKAADGLKKLTEGLSDPKLATGADTVARLGAASSSAATGMKSLVTATAGIKDEVAGLKDQLDRAVVQLTALEEQATKTAPVLRDTLTRAVKTLGVEVGKVKDSFVEIDDRIKNIGLTGIPVIETLINRVNALAAALAQATSKADGLGKKVDGLRLPVVGIG